MKKLFLSLPLLSILLLTSQINVFAQNYIPNYMLQQNEFISHNFEVVDSSGWFQATRESKIVFTDFIQEFTSSILMGSENAFSLTKTTNDDYPFMERDKRLTHHRYNQIYKGVKVEYAELFLHHKDNRIVSFNCKLAEGLNLSVLPSISENQALTSATNYLGANFLYTWQDSTWEADYKDEKENPNATTYPTGELVISKLNVDKDYSASQFVLAWKFKIQAINPALNVTIYINANTGAYIKQINNNQEGNADLSYGYGNKFLDTEWRGGFWSHFRLKANDISGRYIWTKKQRYIFGSPASFGGNNTNNSHDADDNWGNDRASETTPHWVVAQSWDYFKNTFNRSSIDNAGKLIKIYTDIPEQNAFFDGYDMLSFGNNGGNHLGTKDIGGHEYTHGVTQYCAGLVYQNESGALNESFSDIFGYEVERYTNGGMHTNWNIGEDAWLLRKINNPANSIISSCHNQSQPAFYFGARWYSGSCDNGGVHINSGVQNYWFYLLTQGSVGAPEGTFNNISVSGIGADKARNITYYNLDVYMGANSSYLDARNGAVMSAINIYGLCSDETKQTKNAWAGVGIGLPSMPLTITGPSTMFHYGPSGAVMGGMPKTYTANSDIHGYSWIYSGPWLYSTSGGLQNKHFYINNFNLSYTTGIIQVNDQCECVSKKVYFCDLNSIFIGIGNSSSIAKIYPNPARDIIHVAVDFPEAEQNAPIIIKIIDMKGVCQFQQTYTNGLPESINISNLIAGNYLLIVNQGNYFQQIRFIKQ
jgi:Zn-dependent metalloprotease